MSKRWSRLRWELFPNFAPLQLAILLSFALLPLEGWAQAPEVARLDAFVAEAQKDWPVPGLAVVIVKDGEMVLAKGYGVRELGGAESGSKGGRAGFSPTRTWWRTLPTSIMTPSSSSGGRHSSGSGLAQPPSFWIRMGTSGRSSWTCPAMTSGSMNWS